MSWGKFKPVASLNLTPEQYERFLFVVKKTGDSRAGFVRDVVMGAVEDQLEALGFHAEDYL